ncbi:MAG: three-Cys-motif partner protein TcmP [Dehalococcoidia bacterium]
MPDLAIASDGLLARVVDDWAIEKLHYVERYMDIFTRGMRRKWRYLNYVDLFAGPGKSIIRDSQREIDGSPVLALKPKYPFTDLYFNEIDKAAVEALRRRIRADIAGKVIVRGLDCNVAARDAADSFLAHREPGLTLAFIDPTGFQISLDSLAYLTRGHSVDLIITLMTTHLRRLIAIPTMQDTLDAFFGSRDWRTLVDLRQGGGRITYRKLLDYYEEKLKALGFDHVDDDIRILKSNRTTNYHLVFASKHPRGAEFFRKISKKQASGQQRLL